MKKLVVLSALALFSACNVEVPPIESGFTADTWVTESGPFKAELSPDQLRAMAAWFAAHRTGWEHRVTDTPPGPMILLKHAGGRTTRVQFNRGEIWIGNRVKRLTAEEEAEIRTILTAKNQLPVFTR